MSGVDLDTCRQSEVLRQGVGTHGTRIVCVWNRKWVTINSKNVFDLLLYDFQSHFDPVRVSHGMHLIRVQPVDVQDLEKQMPQI